MPSFFIVPPLFSLSPQKSRADFHKLYRRDLYSLSMLRFNDRDTVDLFSLSSLAMAVTSYRR